MTHANRVLQQLKLAEEDDDLPEEIRERSAERREELEAEVEEAKDHVEGTNQGDGQ